MPYREPASVKRRILSDRPRVRRLPIRKEPMAFYGPDVALLGMVAVVFMAMAGLIGNYLGESYGYELGVRAARNVLLRSSYGHE